MSGILFMIAQSPPRMERNIETTCRALILNVMVCMMEVDGVIDEREIKRIGDVYEEIVGFRLKEAVRERLIGSVMVSRAELLDQLKARACLLDDGRRRQILRAGLLVLQADMRADPRERRFLRDVGSALGMTREQIDTALESGQSGP